MCGIAGMVYSDKERQVPAVEVRQMCDQIIHRGPDDEGVYAKGHVGLGMRRLSIIDPVSYTHLDVYKRQDNLPRAEERAASRKNEVIPFIWLDG